MSFSSRPPNKSSIEMIGLTCFFDFLCAVFSRIAYEETPRPLFLLSEVFNIIPDKLIKALGQIRDVIQLNDDTVVLEKLEKNHGIPTRTYDGKEYINFISYAEKINILIEGANRYDYYKISTNKNIMVESIATSNYGNVLIIGIKTMPNFVFTAFRGTYSAKTAASYSRPSSIFPLQTSKDTKVLGGIGKILFEMMNTILESNKYIASTFLEKKNVIPVFTGHSLGGGLCTILDYEYLKLNTNNNKDERFNSSPLSTTPICITFGSPRVLSKTTSETLCKYIVENKTLFKRYSNDGDPITALPPINYYHPCSSTNNKASGYRKLVSRDCKSSTIKTNSIASHMPSDYITSKITYDLPHAYSEPKKPINCRGDDTGPGFGTKLFNIAPNMFDHMTYLYISFARAAIMTDLVSSAALMSEITRVQQTNVEKNINKGDTVMAIYIMRGDGGIGEYTMSAVDLVKIRNKNKNDTLMIDSDMNDILFNKLIDSGIKVDDISFNINDNQKTKDYIKNMESKLKNIPDDKLYMYIKETTSEKIPKTSLQQKAGKSKTRRSARNVSKRKMTKRKLIKRTSKRR